MTEHRRIAGAFATTHLDRHGERLTKEALEDMAAQYATGRDPSWIYWNHETTLPPIGVLESVRVEGRPDGEYQLSFEGDLLGSESYDLLIRKPLVGLQTTESELLARVPDPAPQSAGRLTLLFDPRNFEEKDVEAALSEIAELLPVESAEYVRKAEIPHAVIWLLVGWAGGQLASGFISRIGELAADATLAASKAKFARLNVAIGKLLHKAKPHDRPDVIFGFHRQPGSPLIEAAVEHADPETLQAVWESLPLVYALANTLIERNRADYFVELKFLYNPASRKWEINYLTTRRTKQVILGPRYYVPDHPLYRRWQEAQDSLRAS